MHSAFSDTIMYRGRQAGDYCLLVCASEWSDVGVMTLKSGDPSLEGLLGCASSGTSKS